MKRCETDKSPQQPARYQKKHLQSWVGVWLFPKGSTLSQRALVAVNSVLTTAGRKFMTFERLQDSIYGTKREEVVDGVLETVHTYNVRIGKNSLRFYTFHSTLLNQKDGSDDNLLLADPTDAPVACLSIENLTD